MGKDWEYLLEGAARKCQGFLGFVFFWTSFGFVGFFPFIFFFFFALKFYYKQLEEIKW